MARIAFFLDTRCIRSSDVRNVDAGNPGIGGTEYMFFLVAAYLARSHQVSMYVTAPGSYPPGIRYVVVRDFSDAAVTISSAGEQIVILRDTEVRRNQPLLHAMKQRVLVWAHNFSRRKTLKACARCPSITRYLCVSREQHARLRDEDLFAKSDYIFNAVVTKTYPTAPSPPTEDNVFYMGSLVKSKGFHIVARYWADIVKAVPTARLHVVGSGRLYNEEASLGPLGIASADYEQQFAEYVTEHGRLRKDIVFHGILGTDKWRFLRQAKVAITNPTGVGETFCIAAAEFGALGVPVVTRKAGGLIDVVDDGVSGILIDAEHELPEAVVGLLTDENRRVAMGRNAMARIRSRFDIEVVIGKWENTIQEILASAPVAPKNRTTTQQRHETGRAGRRRKPATIGVGTAVLKGYLRHSPIEPGKAWLWKKLLDRTPSKT